MASFWLEFDQDGRVQKFPFDKPAVAIGRDKSSDFVLDHPTISRQHAVIVTDAPGVYRLMALSRGGGTAMDGVPVTSDAQLHDGAYLQLGQIGFRFHSEYAPRRQAAAPAPRPAPSPSAQPQGFAQGGWNAGAPAGFGQPPGQGFGAPAPGGFGQAPAQGFGGAPGGFGQGAAPGGFGQASPSPVTTISRTGADAGGIKSWDEIAQSADNNEEVGQAPTNFEKIQSASKNEKSNPVVVLGGGLLAVGMLVWSFMPAGGGGAKEGAGQVDLESQPPVEIVVDCLGESDCVRQAQKRYQLGKAQIDKKDVEVANLFEGYRALLESQALLEKGGVVQLPTEMADVEARKVAARAELDALLKKQQVRFHQSKLRDDHREMVVALDTIKSYFPNPTAREHKWALQQEVDMKNRNIYPRNLGY